MLALKAEQWFQDALHDLTSIRDQLAAGTRDGRPYEDELLPLDELRVAVV